MGKKKMDKYFSTLQKANKKLFVPYIVAGDGGLDCLIERIHMLDKAGVAAIEIGIPFSDPVADGPTIQEAGIRALKLNITLNKVLDTLASNSIPIKAPIIIMTYINPIFVLGIEYFADKCKRVGVDGVLIPDLPMEEEELVKDTFQMYNIAIIRLIALTSTKERIEQIAKNAEGFLYLVSVAGTTGARVFHQNRVYDYLKQLKSISSVPVLAGFGVSTSNQAQRLNYYCDGLVVGSKIVDLFHQGKEKEIQQLIHESI